MGLSLYRTTELELLLYRFTKPKKIDARLPECRLYSARIYLRAAVYIYTGGLLAQPCASGYGPRPMPLPPCISQDPPNSPHLYLALLSNLMPCTCDCTTSRVPRPSNQCPTSQARGNLLHDLSGDFLSRRLIRWLSGCGGGTHTEVTAHESGDARGELSRVVDRVATGKGGRVVTIEVDKWETGLAWNKGSYMEKKKGRVEFSCCRKHGSHRKFGYIKYSQRAAGYQTIHPSY